MVFLHSRLNALIMIFRFDSADSELSPSSSSDPVLLRLSEDLLASSSNSQRIIHLHLEQLQFREDNRRDKLGVGYEYLNSDVRFYRFSAMLGDFSIHQTILYSHSSENGNTGHIQLPIKLFSWDKVVYPRHGAFSGFLSEHDFLVPDGTEALAVPKGIKPYQAPRMLKNRVLNAPQNASKMDIGFMYEVLIHDPMSVNGDSIMAGFEDISTAIHRANNIIESTLLEEVPQVTL